MSYQLQVIPRAAPASAPNIAEETLRDTQFRFECRMISLNAGGTAIIAFTDPVTGQTYTPVGGGSYTLGSPVAAGDFTALRTYFTDAPSISRPGAAIPTLDWRGKDAVTITAFVRFNAAAVAGYTTQHIIGDYTTSDGAGVGYIRLGLNAGKPTLSARHSASGEDAVLAQLPITPADGQCFGLIGEVDYTTGLLRLKDVISGTSISAQGDTEIWDGPAGNPAVGGSFLLTRGTFGTNGQGLIGDLFDSKFWNHARSARQKAIVERVYKQRAIGVAAG